MDLLGDIIYKYVGALAIWPETLFINNINHMKTNKIFSVLIILSLFFFTSSIALAENEQPIPTLFNIDPPIVNLEEEIDESLVVERLSEEESLEGRKRRMTEINREIVDANDQIINIDNDELITQDEREDMKERFSQEAESLKLERRELLNHIRSAEGEMRLTDDELDKEERASLDELRKEAKDEIQERVRENVKEMVSLKREERNQRYGEVVERVTEVAANNEKVAERLREVMEKHEINQKEVEASLENVSKRSGFIKFLIGPKYSDIKKAEQRIIDNEINIDKLKQIAEEIELGEDGDIVNRQIEEIRDITNEIKEEIVGQRKGISLFGWLNRMLNK